MIMMMMMMIRGMKNIWMILLMVRISFLCQISNGGVTNSTTTTTTTTTTTKVSKKTEDISGFFSGDSVVVGVAAGGVMVLLVTFCIVVAIILRRIRSRSVILNALHNQKNYGDNSSVNAPISSNKPLPHHSANSDSNHDKNLGIIQAENFNKPMDFNTIIPISSNQPEEKEKSNNRINNETTKENSISKHNNNNNININNINNMNHNNDNGNEDDHNGTLLKKIEDKGQDMEMIETFPALKLTDDRRNSLSRKKYKHEAQSSFFGDMEAIDYFAEEDLEVNRNTRGNTVSKNPQAMSANNTKKGVVSEEESRSRKDSDSAPPMELEHSTSVLEHSHH